MRFQAHLQVLSSLLENSTQLFHGGILSAEVRLELALYGINRCTFIASLRIIGFSLIVWFFYRLMIRPLKRFWWLFFYYWSSRVVICYWLFRVWNNPFLCWAFSIVRKRWWLYRYLSIRIWSHRKGSKQMSYSSGFVGQCLRVLICRLRRKWGGLNIWYILVIILEAIKEDFSLIFWVIIVILDDFYDLFYQWLKAFILL